MKAKEMKRDVKRILNNGFAKMLEKAYFESPEEYKIYKHIFCDLKTLCNEVIDEYCVDFIKFMRKEKKCK